VARNSQESSAEPEILTWQQMQFLAKRLLCSTDKEAAGLVGVVPETVYTWKNEKPAFAAAYAELGRDGLELAKKMVRQNMAHAAAVMAREAIDAHLAKDRIDAAYKILTLGGLSTTQNINVAAAPDDVAGALGWQPKDKADE
jgi:hypothetical protein